MLCLECRRKNFNVKLFSDIAPLHFLKLCKECKSIINDERWFMKRQLDQLMDDNELHTSYTIHLYRNCDTL